MQGNILILGGEGAGRVRWRTTRGDDKVAPSKG